MQRQLSPSSSLQPISVKWIWPVSSSSSLTRQQRPHPSQRLSHSLDDISSSVLVRQNGSASSLLFIMPSNYPLPRLDDGAPGRYGPCARPAHASSAKLCASLVGREG